MRAALYTAGMIVFCATTARADCVFNDREYAYGFASTTDCPADLRAYFEKQNSCAYIEGEMPSESEADDWETKERRESFLKGFQDEGCPTLACEHKKIVEKYRHDPAILELIHSYLSNMYDYPMLMKHYQEQETTCNL